MSPDLSRIHVELQEHPRWRRTLSVSVPPDVMRAEREKSLELLARRVRLPGFRKGKAPAAAIERQYGQTIDQETMQRVVDEAYRFALAEQGLQPISPGEVEGVEYQPGGAFAFRVSFDVRPVIPLTRLEGFVVQRSNAGVQPADVDEVLKRLREENGVWRPPDDDGAPRDGDLVTVQIVPVGGQGVAEHGVGLPWARRLRLRQDTDHRGRYQFVLGEGDAVPDLERAVRSLAPGQSGEFSVLDGSTDAGRSGSRVQLRLTLEDRRMRELPDLDDDFARSLGDFPNVAALRRKIADDLEAEAREGAEAGLRERLVDEVLQANPFDVPASLVDRYLESAGPAASGDLRAEAERLVKRALLIEEIAASKDLKPTAEEVEGRITEVADAGGVTPEQVRARLTDSDRMEALERDITERKVFRFLISQSRIVDER